MVEKYDGECKSGGHTIVFTRLGFGQLWTQRYAKGRSPLKAVQTIPFAHRSERGNPAYCSCNTSALGFCVLRWSSMESRGQLEIGGWVRGQALNNPVNAIGLGGKIAICDMEGSKGCGVK